MISLPISVLTTKEEAFISLSTVQEHQKFCKALLKSYHSFEKKKSEDKDKNKLDEVFFQNQKKQYRDEIMKWFGKLTIEERIKICTIQNKWLVNLILQLHLITTTYDNVSFKPIYQMANLFKDNKHFSHIDNNGYSNNINLSQNINNNNDTNLINDLSFYENFFSIQYPEFGQSYNNNEKKNNLEKEFNALIRIISLSKDEQLDTITFATEILMDIDKFKNMLNFFSNEKYFQEWLLPIQINNNYNFVFPAWMHNINLTIFELLTGYFEQQILLHYEYFYYSKKIYEYSYSDKIVDLYNENKKLCSFVKENYSTFYNPDTEKKEFISRMEIREIVQFVRNNKSIKPKIDYIYNLYEISFPTTIMADKKFNNLLNSNLDSVINEDLYKEMISFGVDKVIEHITFYSFLDIMNFRSIVFSILRKRILDHQCQMVLDELLKADLKSANANKKKRNNKKKKKKNKNIEEKDENIEKSENININIKEDVDIKDTKIDENKSEEIKKIELTKELINEKDNLNINMEDKNNTNVLINYNNEKIEDNKNIKIENPKDLDIATPEKEKEIIIESEKSNINNDNNNENEDKKDIKIISEENISSKKNKSKEMFLYSTNTTKKKNKKKKKTCLSAKKSINNKIINNEKKIYDDEKKKDKNSPSCDTRNEKSINIFINSPSSSKKKIDDKDNNSLKSSTKATTAFLNKDESISFENEFDISGNKQKINIDNNNLSINDMENINKIKKIKFQPKTTQNNITINNCSNSKINSLDEIKYNTISSNIFQNFTNNTFINYLNVPIMSNGYTSYTPSEKFFDSLTSEIKNYNTVTLSNVSNLNPIRNKYLNEIENMIKSELDSKYEIKYGHYGSHFTNLSIEGSDVDIVIYYKNKNGEKNKDFFKDILFVLNQHEDKFESIHPILTASVPVIKLQIGIKNDVKDLKLDHMGYLEGYWEFDKINFDLTFTQNEQEYIHSQQVVDYINKSLDTYPIITQLLLLLKRYFKIMKMNKSFHGGLSSYSLYLLILSFCKKFPTVITSKGKALFSFLGIFAYFEFDKLGINIEDTNIFYYLNNSMNINNNISDDDIPKKEINLIDPLTKLNVAKSSFKVDEIQTTFRTAYDFLRTEGCYYDYAIFVHKTGYDNDFFKQIKNNYDIFDTSDFKIIKKMFTLNKKPFFCDFFAN